MSSTNTEQPSGMGTGFASWIVGHIDLILSLPEPGEEYYWYDILDREDTPDSLDESVLNRQTELDEYGVIRRTGTNPETRAKRYYWETNPQVYDYAKRKASGRRTFPCGHNAGFRTVDADAGVYECGWDYCNETFDRETVERVMG